MNIIDLKNKSLNPCFNGRYSQSMNNLCESIKVSS